MAIKKIIIEYEDNDDCLKDFWKKEKIEKEIQKYKHRKTAEEMFDKLGFVKREDTCDDEIGYVEIRKSTYTSSRGRDILFLKKDGSFEVSYKVRNDYEECPLYKNNFRSSVSFNKELILAIVEQLSELWEENNK